MKKILALLLALVMVFSFAACGLDSIARYSTGNIYAFSNVLPIGRYKFDYVKALELGIIEEIESDAQSEFFTNKEIADLEKTEGGSTFTYYLDNKEACKALLREYYARLVKYENCIDMAYSYENGPTVIVINNPSRGSVGIEGFEIRIASETETASGNELAPSGYSNNYYTVKAYVEEYSEGSYCVTVSLSSNSAI